MAISIRCADCGTPRQARNRNTRYCHHCRLLRNIEFFRQPSTHRTCSHAGCENRYAPTDRTDALCGEHEIGYSTLRGTCVVCRCGTAFLCRPGVPVCISCVRDPRLRLKLIVSLQKGQAKRKATSDANPHHPEEVSI